ncbi:GAF domain-containing protein [Streptomyces sp. RKND-216]|uniref:SpoIIE family protein phosphatase n=1 Tax=Streptomyces sp. RKND-216 TaxID=2562581 RepID=UPI00109DE115|nr:SpoIIE family protein phosphatase [Streptomyces sp. RKND-216]THA25383.1 GAF domain-containing protein [Streptomyces sp. RKND-216]
MRTEDVLTAVGTGVWRWEGGSQTVTLDARAARLLGLPSPPSSSGTVTLGAAAVRGRVHAVDFVRLQGMAALALTEGRLAEGVLRVVCPAGTVLRSVRVRLRPVGVRTADQPDGRPGVIPPGEARIPGALQVIGTVSEVAPVPEGSDAPSEPDGEADGRALEVVGEWNRSREAFLLDAGRALAEARSTSEVLRVAAALSMPGFTPDGLGVFGVEGDRLAVIGHHGQSPGDEGPFLDMPLDTDYPAAEVVRTGRAIYLPSPDAYRSRFPTTWPLAEPFGRASWAFLPLIVGGRTIGAWMAGFAEPVAFTPDERSVLSTVARMLAQALSRAYVQDSERELADDLQRMMRPADRPAVEGLQLAARYVPTGGGLQVGGDWYDVISLPSGRTAVVVGDVQGHDVRAAGIMAQLRIALRAYAAEGHHPDGVLSRASRFLSGLNRASAGTPGTAADERFATCLYLEIDPRTGTVDVARAGHLDPAIRLPDSAMLVRQTAGGIPLGITADPDYPTTRLVLQPGETMLLCTDGLIETGGHDIESGWERLRQVVAGHPLPEEGLEGLADAVVNAVHGPPSHHTTGPLADRRDDDIALVLLCREGDPLGPAGTVAAPPARRSVLTVAQAEPARIADARHQLGGLLHDWKDGDQADGAVLMLSEMLTNVLVHTDGDALMVAEISGDPGTRLLRVDVTDSSDELPHRRSPGELASSGRGLLLLDTLADAWGVEPRGDGKCTWFELREAGTVHG